MNKIDIRNATLDDLKAVSIIEEKCFPSSEAATQDSFEDRISTFSEGFFLGSIGDQIIGFVNGARTNKIHIEDEFFESMKNHDSTGQNFVIFGLDVLPIYQNSGYARQLLNHLIQDCKDKKLNRLILTCKEHLISYYESFGFINEGVSESVHGGAKWYDMYLPL